ncbi:SPFH domain-containing protein [Marinobacter sp. AN1]|uniref:SPFH domain-containing protein n=1 Tax=Marinobacter sp. AN1 TaxID=2886046 RepID=UPI0039B6FC9D
MGHFNWPLTDDYSVRSRLEDILGSETRKAVAKHELIELAHTKKGREPAFDQPLTKAVIGQPRSVRRGRQLIEADISAAASAKMAKFGIELPDIRFKRINYNESVRQNDQQTPADCRAIPFRGCRRSR